MKKLIFTIALSGLLFASCSNDEQAEKTETFSNKEITSELTKKQIEEVTKITIEYATSGTHRDGIKCSTKKGSKSGGLVLEYSGFYLAAEWFTDSQGKVQVKLITTIDSGMVNWYCDIYTKM